MGTKTTARKRITQKQYDAAVERFSKNKIDTAKIIADSEEVIQAEMKERKEKLGTMPKEMQDDVALIKQYCEDHKAELFADSKTLDTGLGVVIKFRTGTPKLIYGEGVKADDLLKELKKKELLDYITVKESVNARAIIAAGDSDVKLSNALDRIGASVDQEETINVD